MSGQNGSGVGLAGYLLARALVAYRQRAKLTHKDIADFGIASKAKLSAIENGHRPVRINDVIALCHIYKVGTAETDRLMKLCDQAGHETWADAGALTVGESEFSSYLGSEGLAADIRIISPGIPGLVQAPGFARVVASTGRKSPDDVARLVALRLGRQEQNIGRAVVRVAFDEGALSRVVGSPDCMTEQKRHLIALSERGAKIRVFTFDAGNYRPSRGEVTVLTFAEEIGLDPVVYEEGHLGGRFSTNRDRVRDVRSEVDSMFSRSIPIEEYLR